MKILPTDLVLEVGSGDNPNPRSDILCDRFIKTNSERAGEFKILIDRPFVVADGCALPFGNKSFDYVICSHILEHMDNPQGFIKEIVRVGKAGYIEVPSALSERLFGWSIHHWYCNLKKGSLTLIKKTEGVRFGGFFHNLIAEQVWFRRFFETYEDKFYLKLEWKDTLKIDISEKLPPPQYLATLDNQANQLLAKINYNIREEIVFYFRWILKRIQRKFKKSRRLFFWKINIKLMESMHLNKLNSILVCPNCQAGLAFNGQKFSCTRCKLKYSYYHGIPIMLLPKELKKVFNK